MTDRPANRDELLRLVVRADLALRDEGRRERFRVRQIESHRGAQIVHDGFRRIDDSDRNSIRCDKQDVEDLAAAGFIRLERHKRRGPAGTSYEEWDCDVTKTGFERIEREERAVSAAAAAAQEEVAGGLVQEPDAYERLLELIDEHIQQAASEEERSRWERLNDAVAGIGRNAAVEVLNAAAQAGLRR